MDKNYDFEDYGDQIREVGRALEKERECLMERAGWLNGLNKVVKAMSDVVKENERLKEENEELRQRLEELCKASQPTGSVAFYNYGTYNEVQGGGLNLTKKN